MDKFEDNVTSAQLIKEYEEIVSIVPALHKYKADHNIDNLKKLCNEVSDFCSAIYASTQNNSERAIYNSMARKINK